MKLTAILLTAACLQLAARTSGQTVTLNLKDAPVQKVFKEVSRQTGVSIVYAESLFRDMKLVTIRVKDATLQEVLEKCLKGQPFNYTLKGNSIVISTALTVALQPTVTTPPLPPPPPPIDVKGQIVNENGEPVVGASVIIKGTTIGVSTNGQGYFELKGVDKNITLLITGVNIESKEVKIIGVRTEILITVTSKVTAGEDVSIKAGYYDVKKREMTGNISRVDAKTIGRQPVANPLQALQGRMPGVYIQQTTGVAGGGFSVLIRGRNSLRNDGNDPLYVVDGVPFTSSPLTDSRISASIIKEGNPLVSINPNDIESIEVLKDADATAIYGSRGANGVVLITTKKGKAGKVKFDFNVYSGAGKASSRMELLETNDYVDMRVEGMKNSGLWPPPAFLQAFYYDIFAWDTTSRNTDWQKELIGGTANFSNAQFSVSGGNANTQFLIGGNYYRETTVFPGSKGMNRLSGNMSLHHLSTDKKFNMQVGLNYSSTVNKQAPVDLTPIAIQLPPNAPALYDPEGKINWEWNNSFTQNPLSYLEQRYQSNAYNLVANSVFQFKISKEIGVKVNLGYTSMDVKELNISPIASIPPQFITTQTGSTVFGTNALKTWIAEPQAEYKKSLGKSEINLLVGSTFQESELEGNIIQATGFSSDALLENILAAGRINVIGSNFYKYRYASLFGRINYSFNKTYFVNVSGRRDASSRFGPGKQFGNFGAVGAAWIFTKGKLFSNNFSFLNFGKLRFSYGTTGSDAIGNYQYLNTFTPTTYPYNNNPGLAITRLDNPDFSWESNRKLEFGLDLSFLKDRIQFGASWYQHRSSNQLVGLPLPVITGQSSVQFNLPATVQNKGWEFQLTTLNIASNNFRWVTDINITLPKNKLLEFPNLAAYPSYNNLYEVGQSIFTKKVLRFEGVDPQTGDFVFFDADGNGSISSVSDGLFLKEVTQQYFGGLNNSVSYKGFQLDFLLQFVKQTGSNYLASFSPIGALSNQPAIVLNRWRNPGDITDIPKSGTSSVSYNRILFSDAAISDASFIRLKNVSLSWQLPDKFKKSLSLSGGRIYFQGQNLFTITNYLGLDPETQNINFLPPLRVLTMGIQITF